jgi:hypothetical protein
VLADPGGVRFGVQDPPGRAVAWLPHPWPLWLQGDLGDWSLECWDLAAGRCDHVRARVTDGITLVAQPEFPGDAVCIFARPAAR